MSFSDSILSGYIQDGMSKSNFKVKTTEYSACVLNYYNIHQQADQLLRDTNNIKITDLSIAQQNYLQNIAKHEIYCIELIKEGIVSMSTDIYIPYNTVSAAACFLRGEEFHPRIDIKNIDISKVTIIDFNLLQNEHGLNSYNSILTTSLQESTTIVDDHLLDNLADISLLGSNICDNTIY